MVFKIEIENNQMVITFPINLVPGAAKTENRALDFTLTWLVMSGLRLFCGLLLGAHNGWSPLPPTLFLLREGSAQRQWDWEIVIPSGCILGEESWY